MKDGLRLNRSCTEDDLETFTQTFAITLTPACCRILADHELRVEV